ncbi:hypothetical protein R8Z50_30250 [Longispora sp. K20-0274]|uniref:hypothetical protein n=1 Tax=Longispora sp. K20-0274 TaxID=3088255 RepID=UPI00399A8BD4
MKGETKAMESMGDVLGILETTRPDPHDGACRLVGLDVVVADGYLAPNNWMALGDQFELRHDGTGWTVNGGHLAAHRVHRLTFDGRYDVSILTSHRYVELDTSATYKFLPVPCPEPTWLLVQATS